MALFTGFCKMGLHIVLCKRALYVVASKKVFYISFLKRGTPYNFMLNRYLYKFHAKWHYIRITVQSQLAGILVFVKIVMRNIHFAI